MPVLRIFQPFYMELQTPLDLLLVKHMPGYNDPETMRLWWWHPQYQVWLYEVHVGCLDFNGKKIYIYIIFIKYILGIYKLFMM